MVAAAKTVPPHQSRRRLKGRLPVALRRSRKRLQIAPLAVLHLHQLLMLLSLGEQSLPLTTGERNGFLCIGEIIPVSI